MSLMQVKIENLKELDGGKAVKLFEQHLKRAAEDCEDRPRDKKAREVTLVVKLVPVCEDEDDDCAEVKATVFSTFKVPPQKTRAYSFGLRRGGMLVFNPDSDTNVNQATLMDGDE